MLTGEGLSLASLVFAGLAFALAFGLSRVAVRYFTRRRAQRERAEAQRLSSRQVKRAEMRKVKKKG